MQAKLRRLHSSGIPDLRTYRTSKAAFCLVIQAVIGPADEAGGECFDIEVCSPAWLVDQVNRRELVSGRCRIFMVSFNYETLERYVLQQVALASGETWADLTADLVLWSHWEFADYIEA